MQSSGSRCVKPQILLGDVRRPHAMTVAWKQFAQALTDKPMKGMLTGPVTILNWSFVRDDQPRALSCQQLALADWQAYLDRAVAAFRLAANGVADRTQIHTHMCYSRFNDIIASIAGMDADVITIETSRSDMALLDAFDDF